MKIVEIDNDTPAREQAIDVTASFAVQAPAGSGKTELLMQRFLALLSIVSRPEEILALTFTRKAAGEMHSRIIAAMRKAAEGYAPSRPHEAKTVGLAAKALQRDAEMGWSLLENPGRLKVQTIDSFSSTLARQMPVLSGLGSYALTEEPSEFYEAAAEATIALVEDDGIEGDAVRSALDHLDNSVAALSRRLVMMLGRRDQWLRHLERESTDDELKAELEGSLKRLVEFELKRVVDSFPHWAVEPVWRCGRFAASNLSAESLLAVFTDLKDLPGDKTQDLPLWKGIRELLLTQKGELRKPRGITVKQGFPPGAESAKAKEEFQSILAALEDEEGLIGALGRVEILPSPEFEREEWEVLLALIRLLPIAERKLMEVFAEAGVVDFQAVSLAAIKALGTDGAPTDLMLSLDLKVQHILVDEYQDTSQTQLTLLEALTRGWTPGDGRTLFVVGDPMQSIYLFREAEVGLFLEARLAGVGAMPLMPLTLTKNFRSGADIVSWVNDCLGRTFPEREDTFTGAVTYAPSAAVKEVSEGRGVDIRLFNRRNDGGRNDGLEAEEVLKILDKVPATETTAILCRSRAHVHEIVNALNRENRPFRAEEIDPLSSRPVIQDLLALLKALDHPLDRISWLASLRAPWCGLALSDLLILCMGDKAAPVWELVHDDARLDALSNDGRERLFAFRERMSAAMSTWGRRPPVEVLRGLWISIGGLGCIDRGGMDDAEEFFDLLQSVQEQGRVDIPFLEARIEGLYAGGGNNNAPLEVMTIHKAKGLEFDNVIIPGLGKSPRSEDKRILVWMERGDDLLLAPMERKGAEKSGSVYGYLFGLHREKVELEAARLLYVAATRARQSLYLLGHLNISEENELRPAARSFLDKISHAVTKEMVIDAQADDNGDAQESRPRRRLPSDWSLPEPAPPVHVDSVEKSAGALSPEFYWAGESVRHLGTVVHRYLCRIAREGSLSWSKERIISEEGRVSAMLRSLGLERKEASRAARQGVERIIKALQDEKGRWILASHPEEATELALTAVMGGEIVHVVIDRTFVDSSGVRWVIDYKTGEHEGGALVEFLKSESDRYAPQLERYAEALKAGGEKREIRKGLYYPAHSAWVEVK
ncbi:MAG: hypothetical protein A2054_03790 [Deltaproteobacteria bacterium GWA2_55_10]|nr:MAG: hypothetical protein A2054_03790 [Deltaproteobacteria bacterium GWA2_55_10]